MIYLESIYMLTNIKYIHFNTPNYFHIQSHNKQLYLGPFQDLINFFNFFMVTQFWMSVGKLFHIFKPLYLKELMPCLTVLHLGCCTCLGFLRVHYVFIVVTMSCRYVGFKLFIHL